MFTSVNLPWMEGKTPLVTISLSILQESRLCLPPASSIWSVYLPLLYCQIVAVGGAPSPLTQLLSECFKIFVVDGSCILFELGQVYVITINLFMLNPPSM